MKEVGFSKVGFVLAAAGSAVGLGNIWKFPYMTGEYGGGAFVIVYLLTLVIVGLPLLMGETILGAMGRKDPVSTYETLANKHGGLWRIAGFSLFTGFLILTFYSVVIGWILYYLVLSFTHIPQNVSEAKELFGSMLTADLKTQVFYYTLAFFITGLIVYKGISKGIERVSLFMMPALVLMLFIMLIYSTSLETFGQSVRFMFYADFSRLSPEALLASVGQAFFTLSVGTGVVMTYASFSNKHQNILKSTIWIIFLDTVIALLAGVMMFAFLFSNGLGSNQGPGLVFISMPATFYTFGKIGVVFSVLFFLSLAFAGITSAISTLEPTISFSTNRLGLSRAKATVIFVLIAYFIGLFCLVSNVKGFEFLSLFGKSFFDVMDFVTSSILLPLGGFVMAIFIGFVVDRERIYGFVSHHGLRNKMLFNLWYYNVKLVSPIALIVVMANMLGLFGSK